MTVLHTACLRPDGMFRGGVRHQGHKTFKLEDFTSAQLRDIGEEPDVVAIVGGEALSTAHIEPVDLAEKASGKKSKG